MSRLCRFPFTPLTDLNSTSGPTVLVAAFSEALRADGRFADLNEPEWGVEDVPWFPVGHHLIQTRVRTGQEFAIGPNVVWGLSYHPGIGPLEKELMAYQNFAAVFCLSRWYSASVQRGFVQKARHYLIDFPVPAAWEALPATSNPTHEFMLFVKGGAQEQAIAKALTEGPLAPFTNIVLTYGRYERAQLLDAARRCRVCYYIGREDNYPLAAVEIGLMGCPIISDERSCPTMIHGLTGLCAPVRERCDHEPFAWAADAAERMAALHESARRLDRDMVRSVTLARNNRQEFAGRVAAALRLQ